VPYYQEKSNYSLANVTLCSITKAKVIRYKAKCRILFRIRIMYILWLRC